VKTTAAEAPLHDRVAHIEGELGSVQIAIEKITKVTDKIWEKIDTLNNRGQPSWQAVVAFGFSAISALAVIGGVIGTVIAMFVRQETAALNIRVERAEKAGADLALHADRQREEKIAELKEALRDARKLP